ncbi:MAG: hypothetical protein OK422_01845 [Thaumarchaeota archaeon]|nr:hypothetical protein [Nitrososphaerota archaeon]
MLREASAELRLVEFLAILAALLGVVYSVFPSQPSVLGSFPLRDLFAAYLIFFMIYSGAAYAVLLRARPGAHNIAYGSLALFSILLAFEFVLAVFEIISDLPLLVLTQGVVIFFAAVLAVFFLLYYILAKIMGSFSLRIQTDQQ